MHVGTDRARLPQPRGPLSEAIIGALRDAPKLFPWPDPAGLDVLTSDDAQLALACCYELHYASFAGVDERWEWAPEMLTPRRDLERAFERQLFDEIGGPERVPARSVVPELQALARSTGGVSLSSFMHERGGLEQMREFCVHRSEYQLKEADPHTWLIPRLRGRAKAAAVAIQYDEYGEGCAPAMHAELFATTLRALDLDASYGAYRDLLPGSTLATGNLVSMFGLQRRWRGAGVGHLALFEMTSVTPMHRYAGVLKRLGIDPAGRRFYDVHVAADAWHEHVAQSELVAGFLEAEPAAGGTVLFGARALMELERRMAQAMIDAWAHGRSSLLTALPERRAA